MRLLALAEPAVLEEVATAALVCAEAHAIDAGARVETLHAVAVLAEGARRTALAPLVVLASCYNSIVSEVSALASTDSRAHGSAHAHLPRPLPIAAASLEGERGRGRVTGGLPVGGRASPQLSQPPPPSHRRGARSASVGDASPVRVSAINVRTQQQDSGVARRPSRLDAVSALRRAAAGGETEPYDVGLLLDAAHLAAQRLPLAAWRAHAQAISSVRALLLRREHTLAHVTCALSFSHLLFMRAWARLRASAAIRAAACVMAPTRASALLHAWHLTT